MPDNPGPLSRRDPTQGWLYIVLAVAVLLRLGLMLSLLDNPRNFVQSDAPGYDVIAINLINHRAFSGDADAPFQPDAFRTPVYPLFLAGIYAVFGHAYAVAVFVQCLISVVSVYLVFRLGRQMIGPTAGAAAALLTAVDAGLIIHANLLLTETLFTLLLILALTALWRFTQTRQARYGVMCGVWLGLATLCRPVTQYLVFGFAAILLVAIRPRWRRGLQAAVVLILAYTASVSPWLIRNWLTFGTPQVSSIQGYNLFVFNASYLQAQLDHTTLEEAQAGLSKQIEPQLAAAGDNQFEQAAVYQAAALQIIGQHPLDYLRLHIQGAVLMLMLPNTNFLANMYGILSVQTGLIANLRTRTLTENFQALLQFFQSYLSSSPKQAIFLIALIVEMITLLITYGLALIGTASLIRSKRWLLLAVLMIMLIYFAALTGPVGYGRYRVPISPVLALLAGAGLAAYLNRRKSRTPVSKEFTPSSTG